MGELQVRDAAAADLAAGAAAIEAQAEDLARQLRHYRDALEEDPERLAAVEERLDRIARLCRKYGENIDEVLRYRDESVRRLDALAGHDRSLEALAARESELLAHLGDECVALSRARRAAAGDLVRAIAGELEHLGMGNATLSVGFACDDDAEGPLAALPDYEVVITDSPLAGEGEAHHCAFNESGIDRIELLASFNPGESPRPLSAVASGGETSRFLLALTTVLGSAAAPRLVVLDEVDEGVGGRAGALVGGALRRLAERHQVLCVTHLPQVAAFGDHHFVVSKQSDATRTWSEVAEVRNDERVSELAAMLGGLSDANRRAAAELLGAVAT